MMRAHLQKAAIITARLANEDRLDRRLHVVVDTAPADAELCWIFGDGVNQAADFFSDATSIPSRNVTPLTTFGN
jgi:hypothetical protein